MVTAESAVSEAPLAVVALGGLDRVARVAVERGDRRFAHAGQESDQFLQAVGGHASGAVSDEELQEIEAAACPGAGACGGQFTANTMALALTTLGLSPMGVNDIPAVHPDKNKAMYECGRRAVEQIREGQNARQMVSRASLRNAAAAWSAIAVPIASIVGHGLALTVLLLS